MENKQNPTRNCHWVPQSYLNAFACDNAKKSVWRFGKEQGQGKQNGQFEPKKIEKVAVRNHLYVPLDNNGVRNDSFEKQLSSLEQLFAHPFWKRLQTEIVEFSQEPIKKGVALLAANLYLRTPHSYHRFTKIHERLVNGLSPFEGQPGSIWIGDQEQDIDWSNFPQLSESDENDIKRNWIALVSEAGFLAEKFMVMRWTMLVSDLPVFVTSDNPVTVIHPSLAFRGMDDAETKVIFRISPTRVLCFDNRHSEPADQHLKLGTSPAAQNMLMWRGSLEYVFSHRHPDEVFTEMEEAEQLGY